MLDMQSFADVVNRIVADPHMTAVNKIAVGHRVTVVVDNIAAVVDRNAVQSSEQSNEEMHH